MPRWVVGGLLIVFGVLAVVSEHAVRVLETQLAAAVAGMTFATDTMVAWTGGDPVIGFTLGHGWFAGQVTAFTGSAVFVAGIAVIGGVLVAAGRLTWSRGLAITAAGVLALVIGGQLRLLVSAFVIGTSAQQGAYPLNHPIGLAAMIVAALGVVTCFFFAVRTARRARTA
ncbi:hypothetical protein [Leifsonia naganoensis]|uniref:Exosortase/archaeosortase family protein n=1 Tax=Leifsonia naganoensis TaxID=150025 RepID=A0A853DUE8_9MICO|nr:hypothetical protein [Leifsonia naganoensis]NYK10091.1 hypothetical protein [Leifsonia naganoensis]